MVHFHRTIWHVWRGHESVLPPPGPENGALLQSLQRLTRVSGTQRMRFHARHEARRRKAMADEDLLEYLKKCMGEQAGPRGSVIAISFWLGSLTLSSLVRFYEDNDQKMWFHHPQSKQVTWVGEGESIHGSDTSGPLGLEWFAKHVNWNAFRLEVRQWPKNEV